MTREGIKQIENLVAKIEAIEKKWIELVDEWCDNQVGDMPSLPKMVESQLMHLRGLDAKKASEYEWMMII